jgi:hypothetical protein
MTEKLDAVVPRITSLLRMLSSSAEGEILNAVRALLRLLASVGLDIHALTDRIEHGSEAPLSAAEMQRIYDAAYQKGYADGTEHGRRSAVLAAQPIGVFAASVESGVNGYAWQEIAAHCALHKHLFHGNQLEFVEDIPGKIAKFGNPTRKQAEYLRSLFMRKFSGRIG